MMKGRGRARWPQDDDEGDLPQPNIIHTTDVFWRRAAVEEDTAPPSDGEGTSATSGEMYSSRSMGSAAAGVDAVYAGGQYNNTGGSGALRARGVAASTVHPLMGPGSVGPPVMLGGSGGGPLLPSEYRHGSDVYSAVAVAAAASAPTPTVTVRRPTLPEELPAVISLHNAFLQVQYDSDFFDSLATDRSVVTLCAYANGGMVATATARASEETGIVSFFRYVVGGHRVGYIMTLAVLPASRGRGVGTRLVTALCGELAVRHGCTSVALHCLVSNTPARALYAACGFTQVGGVLWGHYEFGGGRHDAIYLERGGLQEILYDSALAAAEGGRGGEDDDADPSFDEGSGGGGGSRNGRRGVGSSSRSSGSLWSTLVYPLTYWTGSGGSSRSGSSRAGVEYSGGGGGDGRSSDGTAVYRGSRNSSSSGRWLKEHSAHAHSSSSSGGGGGSRSSSSLSHQHARLWAPPSPTRGDRSMLSQHPQQHHQLSYEASSSASSVAADPHTGSRSDAEGDHFVSPHPAAAGAAGAGSSDAGGATSAAAAQSGTALHPQSTTATLWSRGDTSTAPGGGTISGGGGGSTVDGTVSGVSSAGSSPRAPPPVRPLYNRDQHAFLQSKQRHAPSGGAVLVSRLPAQHQQPQPGRSTPAATSGLGGGGGSQENDYLLSSSAAAAISAPFPTSPGFSSSSAAAASAATASASGGSGSSEPLHPSSSRWSQKQKSARRGNGGGVLFNIRWLLFRLWLSWRLFTAMLRRMRGQRYVPPPELIIAQFGLEHKSEGGSGGDRGGGARAASSTTTTASGVAAAAAAMRSDDDFDGLPVPTPELLAKYGFAGGSSSSSGSGSNIVSGDHSAAVPAHGIYLSSGATITSADASHYALTSPGPGGVGSARSIGGPVLTLSSLHPPRLGGGRSPMATPPSTTEQQQQQRQLYAIVAGSGGGGESASGDGSVGRYATEASRGGLASAATTDREGSVAGLSDGSPPSPALLHPPSALHTQVSAFKLQQQQQQGATGDLHPVTPTALAALILAQKQQQQSLQLQQQQQAQQQQQQAQQPQGAVLATEASFSPSQPLGPPSLSLGGGSGSSGGGMFVTPRPGAEQPQPPPPQPPLQHHRHSPSRSAAAGWSSTPGGVAGGHASLPPLSPHGSSSGSATMRSGIGFGYASAAASTSAADAAAPAPVGSNAFAGGGIYGSIGGGSTLTDGPHTHSVGGGCPPTAYYVPSAAVAADAATGGDRFTDSTSALLSADSSPAAPPPLYYEPHVPTSALMQPLVLLLQEEPPGGTPAQLQPGHPGAGTSGGGGESGRTHTVLDYATGLSSSSASGGAYSFPDSPATLSEVSTARSSFGGGGGAHASVAAASAYGGPAQYTAAQYSQQQHQQLHHQQQRGGTSALTHASMLQQQLAQLHQHQLLHGHHAAPPRRNAASTLPAEQPQQHQQQGVQHQHQGLHHQQQQQQHQQQGAQHQQQGVLHLQQQQGVLHLQQQQGVLHLQQQQGVAGQRWVSSTSTSVESGPRWVSSPSSASAIAASTVSGSGSPALLLPPRHPLSPHGSSGTSATPTSPNAAAGGGSGVDRRGHGKRVSPRLEFAL